ncbi:MAG: hypothetical protein RLN70_07695, partial [Rhodospirillaceae bacterium]
MSVRVLGPDDTPALEHFLKEHWETSMILRSNLRSAPIGESGRFAGIYAATFDGARITNVAAYYPNYGNIILQAPTDVGAVISKAAPLAEPINGILGPWDQVEAAIAALGFEARNALHDGPEKLYTLELRDLKTPEILKNGTVRCRLARPEDMELMIEWRVAYSVEALSSPDDASARKQAGPSIAHAIENEDLFILESNKLLAMASYNAKLSDVVQIGGVWTPPDLRARGYGRAVTAG